MNKPNKARYSIGMATDGLIPGHDMTGRDDISAKVTRGEAILPVKTVDALGGPAAVKHLIKATNGKAPEKMTKPGGKYATGLVDEEEKKKPVMRSIGEGIGQAAGGVESARKGALSIANNAPGTIAAGAANAIDSFGAAVRTGFTGQKYTGREFEGKPIFGGGAVPTAKNRNDPAKASSIGQQPVAPSIAAQKPVAPSRGIAETGPDYANAQIIKTQPGFLGGIGAQPQRQNTRSIAKPAVAKPAIKPAIDQPVAQAVQPEQPQADYYDGRQAYIDRVGANDPGLQELQRTNRDANEIAVYKSNLAKAGYEGSSEYHRAQALGDQAGAANNPNDPSTWGPIYTNYTDGMAKMVYSPEHGEYVPEQALKAQAARESALGKNVGDPLTYADTQHIGDIGGKFGTTAMDNKARIEEQGIASSASVQGAKIGASVGHGRNAIDRMNAPSNAERGAEDAMAVLRADAARGNPEAIARLQQLDGKQSSKHVVQTIKDYNDFGQVIGERPVVVNVGTGQMVGADSAQVGNVPKATTKAQYDALPPGSIYIGPDGKRATKK